MRDFVIFLGLTIVFMVGVIAGFFYLWYEHNALIRKVQSLEYQLEEHDGLISQNGTSFCVVSSPLCLIVDHRENSLYRENSLDIFPVS